MVNAVLRGGIDSFQGIGYAQLPILVDAHGVIGQHVNALYVVERLEEIAQLQEIPVLVGDARNEDMANPYGLVNIAQVAGASEYVFIGMQRQFTVLFFVDVLDVEKNSIGDGHQTLEFFEEDSLFSEWLCRGVKTSADAPLAGFFEEFDEKVDLHQSLTTAHGDAALLTPVAAEPFRLVEEVIGSPLLPHSSLPRVGIMAELAPHGAALQENQEPYSRSVNGAEALYAVNETFHALISLCFLFMLDMITND